jgi:hypothetical protein
MKRAVQRCKKPHPERGAVLVLVAISMVALLGIAALAVDLGYFFVTRNELQNIGDGSALAGARELGAIYQALPSAQQQTYYCDETCQTRIRTVAQDVATKNRAGGRSMTVRVEDVLIGQWDGNTFTETYNLPDAVYVVSRRDDIANGPLSTFFARALGIDEGSVTALAVAAMTGQGQVAEGDLMIPVTLSKFFFMDGNFCNEYIRFNPTNDPASCGGWTTWDLGSNANNLRGILDGDFLSPELVAGTSIIELSGGNVATALPNMLALFQREGFATDATSARNYLTDGSGNRVNWEGALTHPERVAWQELNNQGQLVDTYYPRSDNLNQPDYDAQRFYHKWETTVPVYDREDCSNPNQSEMVVGFAKVVITDIRVSPDQQIDGVVLCQLVNPEPTRGGGGSFGLKGPIPGLVR